MNLGQLRTEVQTRTGTPTDDSLITAAVLTQLVNAALQHIGTERDWPWLEKTVNVSTVNAQSEYTVPADWMRTVTLIAPLGLVLRRTPIEELEFIDWSGSPRMYGIFGDLLVVKPIPNAVVTLKHRYIGTTPTLTADGDTPTMPAGYHYAIVEYASYLAFRRTGNAAEAGAALAAYEEWRKQMATQMDRYSDSQGGALRADQAVEQTTTVKAGTP